jgi:hypothetical protein
MSLRKTKSILTSSTTTTLVHQRSRVLFMTPALCSFDTERSEEESSFKFQILDVSKPKNFAS